MARSLGHLTHYAAGPFKGCCFCRRVVRQEVAKAVAEMKRRG